MKNEANKPICAGSLTWFDCEITPPNEDGNYIVICGHSNKGVEELSYTADGGWNTHYDHHGKLWDDHKMDIQDEFGRYLWAWAKPDAMSVWFDMYEEVEG